MDQSVDRERVDFVGVDNEAGILAAIEHVCDQGRRTFAFVSSKTIDSPAVLRLRAYRNRVRQLDAASSQRVLLGDYSLDWGWKATQRLLADPPLPEAVVCGADIIALGVIAALREADVDVPGDVAVVGFDDIAFASVSVPTLTTLRQPADAIGAEAVRLLQKRIKGTTSEPQRITLPPELLVRRSTGSSRARRRRTSPLKELPRELEPLNVHGTTR